MLRLPPAVFSRGGRVNVPRTALFLILLLSTPDAAPGDEIFTTMEAEDLRLLYIDTTQDYLAPHVARCFLNSMRFHKQLWGYEPWEPVTLLLNDSSDKGNAGVANVPRNYMLIDIAPLSTAYETNSPNERMNFLMNHEMTHVVAADQAAGRDRFFRKVFRGKVLSISDHPETIVYRYLTAPRDLAPRWYHEGIAVFVETWMSGGMGRAQGAYDEMVFRSKVRDGSRFYDLLGLQSEGTEVDFMVGANSYLYGTRFMSYLAYEHGPDSLIRWVARPDGSEGYYASQFEKVYARPLREAWSDWIEWEGEFQRTNLQRVREYPTTPFVDLSPKALGSVSRAFLDEERNVLYAAFNYPGVLAHIGAISLEDGSVERIVDVKGPELYTVTSLAYDPDSRTLFYATDNSAYRDLRSVDLETGKPRLLLRDVRVGDLVFDRTDRSIWGLRHFNGRVTLVRIPHPYQEWIQVHSFPYGTVVHDIDISPDGRLMSAAVATINGRHSLQVIEMDSLSGGAVDPIAVVDFENWIPGHFTFSPDGRYLYGSSYYTGISNIFRYELQEAPSARPVPVAGAIEDGSMAVLSNAETGFFRPLPRGDDSELMVFRYSGEGFVPATIDARPLEDVSAITFLGQAVAEKHPVVKEWAVGSPADVDLDSLITHKGGYESVKKIRLESLYPVIEGYQDFRAYGGRVNFSDPARFNKIDVTASYSPDSDLDDQERFHFKAKYERYNWRAFYQYNGADFYDLFGPTKTSRRGYSFGGGYSKGLIYDSPRILEMDLYTSFHGNLDALPDYQNVQATFDELWQSGGRLTYRNIRASLGAVDDEKGYKLEGLLGADYVNDELIPSLVGNFDLGFALPLKHSSIWLRTSAGAAFGDVENRYANFFFGGFGNNRIDHGAVKRYREFYAFPGVELNDIPGRNFVKGMIEWNLPPIRFRRIGSPGFYLSWIRPALFATGIKTNLDQDEGFLSREVGNAGIQLDLAFTMLHNLPMTFSAGYAVAFEDHVDGLEEGRDEEEFMFSLKILR